MSQENSNERWHLDKSINAGNLLQFITLMSVIFVWVVRIEIDINSNKKEIEKVGALTKQKLASIEKNMEEIKEILNKK